jgi:hypothetical protein
MTVPPPLAGPSRPAPVDRSSGDRVVSPSRVVTASRAKPSGPRRFTRARGTAAATPVVASGSGEADRDDYCPGGLNIDYEDLFADACQSSSWSLRTRAHVLRQAMIRVSFMDRNLRARQAFVEAEAIRLRRAIDAAQFAPDSEDVEDPSSFPEDSESEGGSTGSDSEEEAEEE